jgi:mRNA-degrading endonuclease RelE of RelBE toxin-antitoxin system
MRIVADVIPRIVQDPRTVGERKSGPLKDCYGFTLSGSGAAYRLIYTVRDEVVIFIAVGPHDAAYRDATKRI